MIRTVLGNEFGSLRKNPGELQNHYQKITRQLPEHYKKITRKLLETIPDVNVRKLKVFANSA